MKLRRLSINENWRERCKPIIGLQYTVLYFDMVGLVLLASKAHLFT